MPTARDFIGTFNLFYGRNSQITLDLYGPDGETPLVIESADALEARLWRTDGAAAALVVTEASTPSVITVTTNGVPNTTPARVVVEFGETDTDGLTADVRYKFELSVKDNSDSNQHKVLCRGEALVKGSPST